MKYLLPFLVSLSLSLLLTPIIIKITRKYGFVAKPRKDRWHKEPTPLFGGIGIFFSFLISFIFFIKIGWTFGGIILCSTLAFILGFLDDIFNIKPQTKFLSQLIIATIAIIFGIKVKIIENPFISIPLSLLWMVGITNSMNILDNMDGLLSGIALVVSLFLGYFSILNDNPQIALFCFALAGSCLGFLIFNFNPAKIFMGDCGSLFIGFSLAMLTIAGTWKYVTNLFFTLLFPVMLMAIPIFDTTLVSILRKMNRRPISQGGKDHSSHRLVLLGFNERKSVLYLIAISFLFAITALLLRNASIYTNIVIFTIFTLVLLFFGIFLGNIKIYPKNEKSMDIISGESSVIIRTLLMYKKQIAQIVVDLILICLSYFSAYLLRFDGVIDSANMKLIQKTFPIIIIIKFSTFMYFNFYKGEWKYISIIELIQIFKACFVSSILSVLTFVILYRFEGFSRAVFIIDGILTFLFISGFRTLLRVFREHFFSFQGKRILIVGAGDGGELFLRELKNNKRLNYNPVGFVDDDPKKTGEKIHGIPVFGTRKEIEKLVKEYLIEGIIVAIPSHPPEKFNDIKEFCEENEIEFKRLSLTISL